MKVLVRDKASTPQTAFCLGWSNKSARWEYRLTCLQLQGAGPGSSRALKRCQKNVDILLDVGQVVGNTSREMELDFCWQMELQDTKCGSERRRWGRVLQEPPDSGRRRGRTGHPKQQERALCPPMAWMHSIPGMQLGQDHLWDLLRHRLYRHTDTFFVDYRYFTASCKCKQLS